MHRRKFVLAGCASAALNAAPPAAPRMIYELRRFQLRNGSQMERTTSFLEKHFVPAAKRHGIGPLGFFSAVIADDSPFILSLVSYPSLEAFGRSLDALASDREFQKGFDDYNSMSELSYIRMENSLLRSFESMPRIEMPPDSSARRQPRIFELRTYESNNQKASARKIRMFNEGEIAIFRRLGMRPVFFGETIVGERLPNLTYMLSFDDLAEREKLWKAFGSDPEWQKMRAAPELADALIVSNISNSILRPLPFSSIH